MFISSSVLRFARVARAPIGLAVICALGASLAAIVVAFLLVDVVARVLDAAAGASGASAADLVVPLVLTAVVTLVRVALLWVRDQAATAAGIAVKREVRISLLRHLFALGPGHDWPEGSGAVHATSVDGVEHLQAYLGFYLPQLVVALVVPVSLIGVLASRDLVVAAVVAFSVAVIPIAQRLWNRMLGERANDHWDAYSRYASRISDTLRGMTTLVALGAASRRARHLRDDAERLRAATNANLRASLGVSVITSAAMSIGTACATLVAAYRAAEGTLEPLDVLLVLFLAVECFRPLQELQNYWHEGFYGIAASVGIVRILDMTPAIIDVPESRGTAPILAPKLELRDVTYRYPGATSNAVSGVNLTIPAGSTVAIVGRSGSGKTTLTSLLTRDRDPDSGTVLIDDQDLRTIPVARYRQATARVAQDIVLLDGSVRDNVMAAAPDVHDAALADAIAIARIEEFTAHLPAGLDSPVGEGGSLLSGGQRQRIALGRALLSRAPLLILDEATSALDAENEALITAALEQNRASRTRTTIVIAHRLSTVANADLIAVLSEGRLVEFGSPADLAAAADSYWSRLVAAQTAGLSRSNR